MNCGNCGALLQTLQPSCDQCGVPVDWSRVQEFYRETPVLQTWITSVGYSVLGFASFLAGAVAYVLAITFSINSPDSLLAKLIGLFIAILSLLYFIMVFIYPTLIYPSFFKTKPLMRSSKLISFFNCFIGSAAFIFGPIGILFPVLWNRNLTLRKKGKSHIVFVSLLAILFIAASLRLASMFVRSDTATEIPRSSAVESTWQTKDYSEFGFKADFPGEPEFTEEMVSIDGVMVPCSPAAFSTIDKHFEIDVTYISRR